jgi:uncharacterized protein (DUF58 family)
MSGLGSFARRFSIVRRLARKTRLLGMTRAGLGYFGVWLGLVATGLYQQNNLILLMGGLAAGPLAASFVISAGMLRRLAPSRRAPDWVFAGDPLVIQYSLENPRRVSAALAVTLVDDLEPVDRSIPGSADIRCQVGFERVAPRSIGRLRWEGRPPARGRYTYAALDLLTRSPFGIVERRLTVKSPGQLLVYPQLGRLTRRWQKLLREALQTRRGRRHDRTAQQQEYHGLRDYRSGDSLRWIHWRTSARTGQLMVKEFEQEKDQFLALLLDPWMPRTKIEPEQREAIELLARFAATVCVETCRQSGRRLLLGWTGQTPSIRQGPASARLLHDVLDVLTTLRGAPDGTLSALFDALPPAIVRDAMMVVVTTRPINLAEEASRSARLAEAAGRGLANRLLVLDAARGDLAPYFRPREGSRHGPGSALGLEPQVPRPDSPELLATP